MSHKLCLGQCGQSKPHSDFYANRNKCKICYKIGNKINTVDTDFKEYFDIKFQELKQEIFAEIDQKIIESENRIKQFITDYQACSLINYNNISRKINKLDEYKLELDNKIKILNDNTEMIMKDTRDKIIRRDSVKNVKNLSLDLVHSNIADNLTAFKNRPVSPYIQSKINGFLSPSWHTDSKQWSGYPGNSINPR